LGTCTGVNPGGTFNNPTAIAINKAGTLAYVTNFYNTVSLCPINADGSLATCTSTNPATLNDPSGVVLSPDQLHLFISNYYTGVSSCPVNNDGSLGTCSATGDNFNLPTGIAIP
jgi:DNA-binding beta-propeller fold protein YncE